MLPPNPTQPNPTPSYPSLGLFARNRGVRKQLEVKKRETKSYREVTNDKQNLRKRLAYSKKLNGLVREMGTMLTNDEEIPMHIWTNYDRLQRDPTLKQRSKEELMMGAAAKTPGPGAYNLVKERQKGQCDEKGNSIPISFGKSERWGELGEKKEGGGRGGEGGGGNNNSNSNSNNKASKTREQNEAILAKKRHEESALLQKKGMKWASYEREKLNSLYWELGR